MTRRLRRAVLAVAVLTVVLSTAVPALASPVTDRKASLREVQAELQKVGTQVEKAVEYYNQAVARLATTRSKIVENQRLLTAAERNLAIANRQLTVRAQSIYKAPAAGFVDVIFSARSLDDLVFYGNAGYSYHVAIYVGGGPTIEAPRTGTLVRYSVVGSAWTGGRF